MKNLNFTLLLFFIVTISCNGQSSQIDTFTGTVKINNQIVFTESGKQATKNAFGQPDNTDTEYWEMDEEIVTNYYYDNGAKFQFADNSLESFIITSPDYYVQMGSFQLKVGDHIDSLQSVFPDSYNNRVDGATSIALGAGDYYFIFIEFNSSNIITKIELRFF